MPPLLILSGAYFAVRLRFFYIAHPIKTARLMAARKKGGISPVRAATVALAGTLGVGNITGVTAAIASGGAGAVFWMEAAALFAMSVKYAETALAVIYRRPGKTAGERWYGGAPCYIADGLPETTKLSRRAAGALGAFFAVLCVGNSFTVGGILQVNAAATAASDMLSLPRILAGVLLALLTAAAVTGGARRISAVTSYMIPAVSALYIFMCAAVIFVCRDSLPSALSNIFASAFSTRAAVGGVGGYAVSTAIRYGVTRGVITNEAGAGTSPTAHACAESYSPEAQGCLGIFEVFADTVVICTLTALAVLTAGGGSLPDGGDAMTTATLAFSSTLGSWASPALALSVFVFVLATLLSQHYYARVALESLGAGRRAVAIFTVLYILMVVFGSVLSPSVVWLASDLTVSVMTTVNVVCLFALRSKVAPPAEIVFRGK